MSSSLILFTSEKKNRENKKKKRNKYRVTRHYPLVVHLNKTSSKYSQFYRSRATAGSIFFSEQEIHFQESFSFYPKSYTIFLLTYKDFFTKFEGDGILNYQKRRRTPFLWASEKLEKHLLL